MTRWGVLVFMGLLGLAASMGLLKYAADPFVWTLALWAVLFAIMAAQTSTTWLRAWFVNLALIALIFGLVESYFWYDSKAGSSSSNTEHASYRTEGTILDGYRNSNHPDLGYAPNRGVSVDVQKYSGDELIYDVIYSIDANGLRRSPPVDAHAETGCILFFGGSFTFGEGVQDHETMPYRVGALTEGRYRSYNFGFHGYGPQQMLSALETGFAAEAASCAPDYVIYQALDRHVLRSAGLVGWGSNGPRYVLNPDRSVARAGTLNDKGVTTRFSDSVLAQLDKSHLYKWVKGRSSSHRVRDEHIAVFGGIVQTSYEHVLAMNPQVEFHVLLWEFDRGLAKRVEAELTQRGIRLHKVRGDILPEADYRATYALGPHDHHPNPLAYDLLARYVVDHILEPTPDMH